MWNYIFTETIVFAIPPFKSGRLYNHFSYVPRYICIAFADSYIYIFKPFYFDFKTYIV